MALLWASSGAVPRDQPYGRSISCEYACLEVENQKWFGKCRHRSVAGNRTPPSEFQFQRTALSIGRLL